MTCEKCGATIERTLMKEHDWCPTCKEYVRKATPPVQLNLFNKEVPFGD